MTDEDRRLLQELFHKISKGDKSAYDIFYEKYYPVYFCFILKRVENKELAEELTQDLFEKLYRKDFRFLIFQSPSSYIFKAAQNLCNDYFRRKETEEKYLNKIRIVGDRVFVDDYTELALDDLMSGLDKIEKELTLLRYDYGYGVNEIAKQIGLSERSLNRKYNEIKRKIQKYLEETR